MGEPDSCVRSDSGGEDAKGMNPRQGFHVEAYTNNLRSVHQVWLHYEINGQRMHSICVWEEKIFPHVAGEVYAEQQRMLLAFRYIAHAMNAGLTVEALYHAINKVLVKAHTLPQIVLPELWFYWASAFDYDGVDETAPTCTHYFVHPELDEVIVWQEDTFVERTAADLHAIHWQDVAAVLETKVVEEAEDAEEESSPT